MKRRAVNAFSLSFLDCMFCGFGAVILLVMIVNADMIDRREQIHRDLRVEIDRLEAELLGGTQRLSRLRTTLEETTEERARLAALAAKTLAVVRRRTTELSALEEQADARVKQVDALKSQLQSLEREHTGFLEEAQQQAQKGQQIRKFVGEGDRQYLTGIRVGGKRIVILVDASASMLDETIVNVIRLRNLADERKRATAKWQRLVATVDWLVSQIPAASRFQIITFNETAHAVVEGTEGLWLDAGDGKRLAESLNRLKRVTPEKGTNLYSALASLRKLDPRPDNIFLLTDGLPTQGKSKPWRSTVSPEGRMVHLRDAVTLLPARVPLNTVLFPMEGDPEAASAFWKLAVATGGSFLTPSRDWP